jgi:hypothetical protein
MNKKLIFMKIFPILNEAFFKDFRKLAPPEKLGTWASLAQKSFRPTASPRGGHTSLQIVN